MKETYIVDKESHSFLISPLFASYGIKHMFTLRDGGVSQGMYSSFNFATGSGEIPDEWENVVNNHAIAAAHLGMTAEDICRTYQTHSSNVVTVWQSDRGVGLLKPPFESGVDGLVTKEKNVLLTVRAADCVPILLYDLKNEICAAVHSGWRGTVAAIVAKAVKQMIDLGSNHEDIIAAIGPSIGQCCYEVGEELFRAFMDEGAHFGSCFEERNGKLYLDLKMANALILHRCGIVDERISTSDECTACNTERFFSHRVMGVNRGTMAAFIAVREK